MFYKFSKNPIKFRLSIQLLLFAAFVISGIFSCAGSSSGGGVSGSPSDNVSNGSPTSIASAAPQTPPSTVSLDPTCEKGAKPEGNCKGSPLPPSIRPCSSNLTVIQDVEAGVWWCGCPANTSEVVDGQSNVRKCVCASGQNLLVNADTGESLGCPVIHNNSAPSQVPHTPCRPGMVLLMPVEEGHPNFCGCPEGTDFVYPEGGGAATGCRCPSGALVQVDPQTSEMVGACPPVELRPAQNDCRAPCSLLNVGNKTICNCPIDFKKDLKVSF